MNRRLVAALFVVLTVAAPVGRAAVEPIVVNLSTNASTSYTVPAGKVFIIENAYSGNRYGTNTSFALIGNSLTNVIYIDNWYKRITPIQPPLKLPEGWVVNLFDPGEQFLLLFGLLVDPEDLYAGIPSRFESVARSGPDIRSGLGLSHGRQPVIRMEQSDDLAAWTEVAAALVGRTTSATDFVITTPRGDPADFLRANVISRKGSGGIKHD